MVEGTGLEISPGRRYIIRRPRLTRLLDESKARVVLLVAAAGYGKTTLARQWLEEPQRRYAWYRGGLAAADVAALAAGLAEAAAEILPGAGSRMRERLRVTNSPEQEADVLAELLAEDLADWPEDAWLAIDDYHLAMDSPAAERFVELLGERSPLRLLLASRLRPSWASARKLLYGELFELDQAALAMSKREASQVLSLRKGARRPNLIELARGWPAVIGLAALTEGFVLPEDDLPPTLYDYFAEELYKAAEPAVQRGLCRLALAPSLTAELAHDLFGKEEAEHILGEAGRLGFLVSFRKGRFELHPLLRTFLERKLAESGGTPQPVVEKLAQLLIERRRWDDVFSLVERFAASGLLVPLLEKALPSLLQECRFETLGRWLQYANRAGLDAPVLDLASAELSFRRGDWQEAEALALRAATHAGPGHPLASQAFFVAGRSAIRACRYDPAPGYLSNARRLALSDADTVHALWGQFLLALTQESDTAFALLSDIERCGDRTPDHALRISAGRLSLLLTHATGSIGDVQDVLSSWKPLLERGSDPMIWSLFPYLAAYLLTLAGSYDEALLASTRATSYAEERRLTFVQASLLHVAAAAQLGRRHFVEARALLSRAEQMADVLNDSFLATNAGALRLRLLLAEGALDEAAATPEIPWGPGPAPAMQGEFLACRALALACAGRLGQALDAAERAKRMTRGIETRALVPCVSAIAALQAEAVRARRAVDEAFAAVRRTGNFDAFVAAYRGFPGLLFSVAHRGENLPVLAPLLCRARDYTLAEKAGINLPRPTAPVSDAVLSRRELEVYELLRQSRSNKEIGRSLYISEATVKVHVRHILRKLGARSRTEAALRERSEPERQATSAAGSLE